MSLVPALWSDQVYPSQLPVERIEAEDNCIAISLKPQEANKYKNILENWLINLTEAFESKTGLPFEAIQLSDVSLIWNDSFNSIQTILIMKLEDTPNVILSVNKFNGELEAIGNFYIDTIMNTQNKRMTILNLVTNPKNLYAERINTDLPKITGAASQIVTKMIEICRKEGVVKMQLSSYFSSIDFYKKNGFIQLTGTQTDFEMNL